MKILVRLPNWLGDMVMSVGFLHQLPHFFPGVRISVIAKKGIHELLPFFPPTQHQFVFNKEEFSGLRGLIGFGKKIKSTDTFDLFFCLPDSFSSAIMGRAAGAKERIGYKKEFRQLLLTHAYSKPTGLHRVEEYIRLLELFTKLPAAPFDISLHAAVPKQDQVVVNINSEAASRKLTVAKAVELLALLQKTVRQKIILIGAPKEREFTEAVLALLPDSQGIENAAGATSLPQLANILASARVLLSTDSGPAHLANALGTPTVVLFGAGNEKNTAPYNKEGRTIIRLGQLSCEPCEKNICTRYATPQCLERLDSGRIVSTVQQYLI
jgi:lipopolysaccharide heptosyltransferase II